MINTNKPCKQNWGNPPKTDSKNTSCCRKETTARGVFMSGKYTKVENPSEEILTYITTAKDMIYVYAVVDLCGKIVLFYHIGNNMMISLITYSIWEASQKETAANGLNLHSDQRSQYTLQE